MIEIYITELATRKATLSGFINPPRPGDQVKVVKRVREREVYDAHVIAVHSVPNNPRGHHWEIEYELSSSQDDSRVFSNYVILEFDQPISLAQLREIDRRLKLVRGARIDGVIGLPALRYDPICGERQGNSVVPTIAADED